MNEIEERVQTNSNNDDDDDDDDNETTQPQSTMMSLLDKYSKMDEQLTLVREEIARLELEIQTRNRNVERLLEERQEMSKDLERISKETEILEKDREYARAKLQAAEKELGEAKQGKEEARKNLEQAKKRSKQYRKQFLESSKSFRKECQKRKATCLSLGLNFAPLAAYSLVFRPEMVACFENADDHIIHEKSKEERQERTRLLEQIKEMEQSHAIAKERRDALRLEKENLLQRSRDRQKRKANLQAQLNRIMKDIDVLTNQKQQGAKQPKTRSIAHGATANPSKNRTSTSTIPRELLFFAIVSLTEVVLSCALVGWHTHLFLFFGHVGGSGSQGRIPNPYAKSKSKTTIPATRIPAQPPTQQQQQLQLRSMDQNPPPGSSSSSRKQVNQHQTSSTQKIKPTTFVVGGRSNTDQYPHRVGRLRTSRDFGLSLRIGDAAMTDSDSDDELLSFVAFGKK